ncbi:hypothetical protein F5884DRAFT_680856, partial [Xylogone sp. PMI_703]
MTINEALGSLTTVLSTATDAGKRCHNERERFFLWGQGLSVIEGDLDEILAHSKELHFQVHYLLLRLGTVIRDRLSRDRESILPSNVLTEQCDHLRILLDATESLLEDPDSEPINSDTISDSDVSEYEVLDIIDDISAYIDCLLDLASSLDNPAWDIQVENQDEHSAQEKESFDASCEEVLIYCRRIRDRFESLPKYLVERLAEANVLRAAALRALREQQSKLEAETNDDFTESLFSSSLPQVTDTTKSTVPSSSIFSSVMELQKHVFEDLQPYMCTIKSCQDPMTRYEHSMEWALHESSHPPSMSSECLFCAAGCLHGTPAYFKHVSAHLREVSLSVLPPLPDEDEGFDSDDSE